MKETKRRNSRNTRYDLEIFIYSQIFTTHKRVMGHNDLSKYTIHSLVKQL
jgi:hypothetical protein